VEDVALEVLDFRHLGFSGKFAIFAQFHSTLIFLILLFAGVFQTIFNSSIIFWLSTLSLMMNWCQLRLDFETNKTIVICGQFYFLISYQFCLSIQVVRIGHLYVHTSISNVKSTSQGPLTKYFNSVIGEKNPMATLIRGTNRKAKPSLDEHRLS